MSRTDSTLLKSLHRTALGGAWVFAAGTLGILIVFIALGWPGEERMTLASSTVDETPFYAIGLTYAGLPGTVLLWAEAVTLRAAILLSVLPGERLRRTGHGLLVTWATLWLANAVWLTALSGMWWLWLIWPLTFGAFFLCTAYRAALGWGRASPGKMAEIGVAA